MKYKIEIRQRNEKKWSTVQIVGSKYIAMESLMDFGKYCLANQENCDFKSRIVDELGKVLCERHLKHEYKNFT